MMGHGLRLHSHVVLDELLDFAAGVFVLAEFDRAVFKLVVESWWAEEDDSPVNTGNVTLVSLHQENSCQGKNAD